MSEVARSYGVARSWIYTLLARYAAEGDAAFEPRSRRPETSPGAISGQAAELIIRVRKELAGRGLDDAALHLEPLPLLADSAGVRVAVPESVRS